MNEPGHLVAGLSHWKFGRFELYRVNPPLVRMVAALPVMVAGFKEDWSGYDESPGARPVFSMGSDFIFANGERSIWLFTIARWTCIPFSLIGGIFCFLWSREIWETNLAGLISLILWCFEPNILAHGELITPDCAATSFGLGASYFFWRWLRKPTWLRALVAGLLLGLAELCKMTWLILFGLWPGLWVAWQLLRRRTQNSQSCTLSPKPLLRAMSQLTAILLLGLCVLNFGYGFDGTLTKTKDYIFISSSLTGLDQSGQPGNRFADSWVSELPIPVPKQYLLGLDVQKHDFEDYDQLSYLHGEWKDGGWWYYYLYGLGVKTPHGTQLLLLIAISTVLLCLRADRASLRPQLVCDLLVLLITPVTVLVVVSSQLEFNHHFRYVLPIFGFGFTFIGVVSNWLTPNFAFGEHK